MSSNLPMSKKLTVKFSVLLVGVMEIIIVLCNYFSADKTNTGVVSWILNFISYKNYADCVESDFTEIQ